LLNSCLLAASTQSIGYRGPARLAGPGFRQRVCSRGARARAPVIQNAGDVHYRSGNLGHAKRKIVILAAVVVASQATDLLDEPATHDEHMAQVHARAQHVR
jgi:hypothetical protein